MLVRALTSLLVAFVALSSGAPAMAQVPLKPNLQPLPPVAPYLQNAFTGVNLRFGTLAWNNGMGPVEIRGGAVSEDGETQEVWQRIYNNDGSFTDFQSGTFIHHATHGHIHFENYATYTLDAIEVVDPIPPGESHKTSFCLLDTQKIDGQLSGAPRKAVYTTCGAVRQGISVGWGDEYGANLTGQAIDVTNFPEGIYRLTIEVDPNHQLMEIDDDDNVSSVRLYMNPATLTLQVLGEDDPGALVRIDSMTPEVMHKGETRNDVIITGEGFDAALPVSFSGSGGPPSISNLVFESGTTIRATVTVGSGGPRRTRTFDLHVGTAVLPDALTVLPYPPP